MQGQTYRYFKGTPLYPFGFGLNYTTFEYSGLEIPSEANTGDSIPVLVQVKNCGSIAGEEVVQLYLENLTAQNISPIRSLKGFERISLNSGEMKVVRFMIEPRHFSIINDDSERVLVPGIFQITVGGNQPDQSNRSSGKAGNVVSSKLILNGKTILMEL
jgi:beta-glucosidase